jgi:hypothetical protein
MAGDLVGDITRHFDGTAIKAVINWGQFAVAIPTEIGNIMASTRKISELSADDLTIS